MIVVLVRRSFVRRWTFKVNACSYFRCILPAHLFLNGSTRFLHTFGRSLMPSHMSCVMYAMVPLVLSSPTFRSRLMITHTLSVGFRSQPLASQSIDSTSVWARVKTLSIWSVCLGLHTCLCLNVSGAGTAKVRTNGSMNVIKTADVFLTCETSIKSLVLPQRTPISIPIM